MNWMAIEATYRARREREDGALKLLEALKAFARLNPFRGADLIRRAALHFRAAALYEKIVKMDEMEGGGE
jgi:hypothetical protein